MKLKLITLFSFLLLFGNIDVYSQQELSSIEIQIKNWSGDLIDISGTMVKIYQDDSEFKTIQLSSNPQIITNVPQGYNYSFEVIRNEIKIQTNSNLFLNSSFEKVILSIPSTGGVKFRVVYNDGNSPVSRANVAIKSTQNTPLITTITNDQGETQRYWLQATNSDDFYFVEVTLGTGISYIYSPVKVSPDAQRDFKITTPWPELIDSLITVSVVKENEKVKKEDGQFVVEIYDKDNKKIDESPVNLRGESYFSNIPVGEYTFKALKSNQETEEFETWGSMKVLLTGSKNEFFLSEGTQILKLNKSGCNCVAFRLDDVQDYSLNQAQMAIIDLFHTKNADLTIGVIGGLIGNDNIMVDFLKKGIKNSDPILEVASHSWNNSPMTSFSKEKQDSLLKNTNQKIKQVLGTTPKVFIPPENVFNQDTIDVLKSNGFTHLSSSLSYDFPPFPIDDSDFYRFPQAAQTAVFDSSANLWVIEEKEKIISDLIFSINNYGFAVIMMHPPDFSTDDNGIYRNEVDQQQIEKLSSVIDEIRELGLEIKPIGQINESDTSVINSKNNVNNNFLDEETIKCNCVSFSIDGLQDYWLNDVQISILKIFEKTNTDLTGGVVTNHFGSDSKLIDYMKKLLQNEKLEFEIANNGWEYEEYTNLGMNEQSALINKGNQKVKQVLGANVLTFFPPFDKFNGDTVLALKSNQMKYVSSSKFSQTPSNLEENGIKHIPYQVTTSIYKSELNQYTGKDPEESLLLIKENLKNQGFSVIRINPLEFAMKINGSYENKVNQTHLDNLEFLIKEVKRQDHDIKSLRQIPQNDDRQIVIPSWIKNNAKWWANSQIDDGSFIQGIEYMIQKGIMKIPLIAQEAEKESKEIPSWVRSNAEWWSNGLISDNDFVGGIEFMIKNGIIRI